MKKITFIALSTMLFLQSTQMFAKSASSTDIEEVQVKKPTRRKAPKNLKDADTAVAMTEDTTNVEMGLPKKGQKKKIAIHEDTSKDDDSLNVAVTLPGGKKISDTEKYMGIIANTITAAGFLACGIGGLVVAGVHREHDLDSKQGTWAGSYLNTTGKAGNIFLSITAIGVGLQFLTKAISPLVSE